MKNAVAPAAQLLGERIRCVRIQLGLSQEAIASLASMHVTNFGKIERGDANPSLLTIVRIAAVLGTDVASLTQDITGEHLPAGVRVLRARDFLSERERRARRSR
ncbi:helix-turn-helix transcriptional regulator [Leifsonia sp. fls2-241-R2A-40a]|uniref:helix-turn-helix domain-containing protein n=1 Tax=Leifsonia sp. fls2-241-R2A-40a TaxID=3040290 RepID=UPI00254D5AD7|nr:helix-turn-helix transcriptional regulator [Leifsonia sp. fls2-241-R2A-40a]